MIQNTPTATARTPEAYMILCTQSGPPRAATAPTPQANQPMATMAAIR